MSARMSMAEIAMALNRPSVYLRGLQERFDLPVFEGAGYSSKGIYRPMLDCIMFSKGKKPFCKICERAIREKIIKHPAQE